MSGIMETTLIAYAEFGPPFQKIINYIQWVIYPVLLLVGGIGNILSFLAMNLPSNRSSVMCFYFKFLAVTDTICLLVTLPPKLALHVPDIMKIQVVGDINCGGHIFIGLSFYNISVWQIIIVAVDRFIAVKFPMKAPQLCTMKRAKLLAVINVASHLLVYFPNIFKFSLPDENGDYVMCATPKMMQWYELGFYIINTIVDTIIPLVLLFVLNIAIIICLNKHSSDMAKTANIDTKSRSKQERTMTVMLIVVATSLLILLIPYTTDFILWECCLDVMNSPPGARDLSFEIGFVACLFSNAINFFLYLASSSKFKADLRLILCSLCGKTET
jgi:hypothetical protein